MTNKRDQLTSFGSILPEAGERAVIVGFTGSGKTGFACWLMRRIPRSPIVIYDTKEENKFTRLPGSRVAFTWGQVLEQFDNPETDYIVFRPPVEDLVDPAALDDYLFRHYMELKGADAYVDEAYSFHNNARPGKGLVALLTRGRSRGISTIISTQRPTWLSRFVFTESQRFYIFRLLDKSDRKRLTDVIPGFIDLPEPVRHGFYYFRSGDDEVKAHRPIKLDPGIDTGYVDVAPPQDEQPASSDAANKPDAIRKLVWI